jgi:hypothetical protein
VSVTSDIGWIVTLSRALNQPCKKSIIFVFIFTICGLGHTFKLNYNYSTGYENRYLIPKDATFNPPMRIEYKDLVALLDAAWGEVLG